MALEAILIKSFNGLRAYDAQGEAALASIPQGECVRVTIKRPRNLAHHKKFWALVAAVFPHQTTYPTEEMLVAAMKVALGYAEKITLPDGKIILMPKSISFATLDQAGFEAFYTRAVDLITTKIIPGVNREDLEREVNDILAGYGAG